MTLDSLLQNKIIKLPKNWRTEGYSSYHIAVSKIGIDYLNLLKELDDNEISGHDSLLGTLTKESLIELCKSTFQSVVNCIKTYLDKGDPHAAYEEFAKRFSAIANPGKVSPVSALSFVDIDTNHYRLRVSQENIMNVHGLFHVPFEKRHVISSYRYSIPGYPTLYLSNSVYVAFKELSEPDYDNLYVSKLNINASEDSPQLLDLTQQTEIGRSDRLNIYLYLARWPLLMACSFKAAITDIFKVEYVLPQIVFLWVKKNIRIGNSQRVIGVRYSSSKIPHDKDHQGYFYNTAIPVHAALEAGYCTQLSKLFSMTAPVLFREALKFDSNVEQTMKIKSINRNGALINYVETDFGKIEAALTGRPLNIIPVSVYNLA